jgi:hypothetical protein
MIILVPFPRPNRLPAPEPWLPSGLKKDGLLKLFLLALVVVFPPWLGLCIGPPSSDAIVHSPLIDGLLFPAGPGSPDI